MAHITNVSRFLGPSLYARLPVLRVTVAWDEPGGRFVDGSPTAVVDALGQVLPGLEVPDQRGSEFDTARLMLAAAVQIQFLSNANTEHRDLVEDALGVHLLCSYENHNVHTHAIRMAVELVSQWMAVPQITEEMIQQVVTACQEFYDQASRVNWSLDYRFIITKARERGVPFQHMAHYCMMLGQGKYRRMLLGKQTDRTSYIASWICNDKSRGNQTLGQAGLPVPRQRVVKSEQEAIAAADSLGYPVVVKPVCGTGGRGVSTNIPDQEAVVRAFRRAQSDDSDATVVETMLEGDQHRFTMINRQMVSCFRQTKPEVVGDGKHTIAQLVEAENRNPRRTRGNTGDLFPIKLDEEARDTLRNAGYDVNSVPLEGKRVTMSGASNTHRGGTYEDLWEYVHPDNLAAAIMAVDVVGLDIAGVDFMLPDVRKSWKKTGGGFLEVNTSPGIWGNDRAVGPLFEYLFPSGGPRVPTAAVMGAEGGAVARMLAHVIGKDASAGLASSTACTVGDHVISQGDSRDAQSVQRLFRHPYLEKAVIQTCRERVLDEGFGFDYCDVAAIMDVSGDRSGSENIGISSEADMEALLAGLADKLVVLNGDDPACRELAKRLDKVPVCFVSTGAESETVVAHVAAGGKAVVLEQKAPEVWITFKNGSESNWLVATAELPRCDDEKTLRSCLFVAAMAHGLGVGADAIVSGLVDYEPRSGPQSEPAPPTDSSSPSVLSF